LCEKEREDEKKTMGVKVVKTANLYRACQIWISRDLKKKKKEGQNPDSGSELLSDQPLITDGDEFFRPTAFLNCGILRNRLKHGHQPI
jgi:hypothetical protein